METKPPGVSIGMPVYNAERYLSETLECLLAQDFTDFELIISDNASTDGTEVVCRAFAARDGRIRYCRKAENVGAAANYNDVFRLARAPFFKWAAHDDLVHPSYLGRCVRAFDESGAQTVVCYGKTVLIDGRGEQIQDYEDGLDLRQGEPSERLGQLLRNLVLVNVLAGLVRTEALRRTRLIGRYGGSDVVLLAELAMQGQFREIPERLFYRRVHQDASMHANETQQEIEAWFDPSRRRRFTVPKTRRLVEHLRAVGRSPLSFVDKAACLDVVLQERFMQNRQWRVLGGEIKQALKSRVGLNGNRGHGGRSTRPI